MDVGGNTGKFAIHCAEYNKEVNITILGVLEKERVPIIEVANKIDQVEANPQLVEETFSDNQTISISAKEGTNMPTLYKMIASS